MTTLTILTDALRAIPEKARKSILVAYALVVVGTQIAEIFVTLHSGVYQMLVIIGGYLGVQSAANVLPVPPVVAPEQDADSGLDTENVPEIDEH